MAASGLQIDMKLFSQRMVKLFDSWSSGGSTDQAWGGADTALAITAPPSSDLLRYLKSSALQTWLLGYEFPDTIFVFLRSASTKGGSTKTVKECHVLCSRSKAALLEPVRKECRLLTGVDFFLHGKEKKEDGSAQMAKLLESIKSVQPHGSKMKLGVLMKEAAEGSLLERWMKTLEDSSVQRVDVTGGFTDLFAVKDESEITNIRKAAFLSASVLKGFVVPKLETVIDEEQKMTHSSLMESTEEVIGDPPIIKVKLKAENCDICYPPVFQSGGSFDLRASAISSDENLYYNQMGVIICSLGARYSSYCSNVARTYLIDATAEQEQTYKLLLKAQEAAIAALKPGETLSAVYRAAVDVIEKDRPQLVPFLTKSAGSGIGIEFKETALAINAKNERKVQAGNVFNVALGLQGLKNESATDDRAKTYAILLADTVIVRADKAEVCTGISSKSYTEVGYSFKDDEEEESEEKKTEIRDDFQLMDEKRKAKLRSETLEATKEEMRRKHQQELAEQKLEETVRRLKDGGSTQDSRDGPKRSTGDTSAYRHVDEVPVGREPMIQVDQRNECVLLPIYGLPVPFHISTVKTVTSQQDGGHSYIRIIFNVPGAGFGPNDVPVQKFPDSVFLKELSFRSSDVKHSNQVVQMMKTMSRLVKQRESERAERATLVTQERLVLSKGRPLRLADLWIRPNFGGRGRKLTGMLEAHFNGFRYQTAKADERVDVLFRNIKHAFFQPAENEMITILHLHLHNPIMVGTKKTKDVQFYAEVMEANMAIGGSRRSGYDPDEIEEEQRERERRNKINADFQMFAKRVQEQWERDFKDMDLEFDVPFRDLGFHGVPHKSSAFIVPTVNCLVELIETPFVVIALNDVEIVSLERIGLGQKTFDMRVVFKDFKRDVMSIDAIPSSSLDSIKEWLNSMNLKYYESKLNLQWRPILQNIIADPESFVETGGWEFLNVEGSDSGTESQESDAYQPSDVEEASESEDDADDDDESVVNSEDDDDDDDGSGEDEEEEEEGLSWDELEERAKREDREKGGESDSEDEKRKRKVKSGGGGGGGAMMHRRPVPAQGGSRGYPTPPASRVGGRPMAGAGGGRPSSSMGSGRPLSGDRGRPSPGNVMKRGPAGGGPSKRQRM